MLAAYCAVLVSGVGFCLVCLNPFVESSHGTEQSVLFVFRVTVPMALLDVVADGFENVGVVEIAQFNTVRLVFDCDLSAVDVDCAVLRIETFCRKFVHRVVCVVCVVLGESGCLPRLIHILQHRVRL